MRHNNKHPGQHPVGPRNPENPERVQARHACARRIGKEAGRRAPRTRGEITGRGVGFRDLMRRFAGRAFSRNSGVVAPEAWQCGPPVRRPTDAQRARQSRRFEAYQAKASALERAAKSGRHRRSRELKYQRRQAAEDWAEAERTRLEDEERLKAAEKAAGYRRPKKSKRAAPGEMSLHPSRKVQENLWASAGFRSSMSFASASTAALERQVAAGRSDPRSFPSREARAGPSRAEPIVDMAAKRRILQLVNQFTADKQTGKPIGATWERLTGRPLDMSSPDVIEALRQVEETFAEWGRMQGKGKGRKKGR